MAGSTSKKSGAIRSFLLLHLEDTGVALSAARHFGITRQAVNRHLRQLMAEGLIKAEGATRDRKYSLAGRELLSESYELEPGLEEDRVWSRDVSPLLRNLSGNVLGIWNFCFTEIFNNAIDHSEGSEISVHLEMDAMNTEIVIHDDGVGIFFKIQKALGLTNMGETVLELVKGKFTTDKTRHSGLGVFFSSRMLDSFEISSETVYYSYEEGQVQFRLLEHEDVIPGTAVFMKLSNSSTRTVSGIFEQFGDGLPLNFNKTLVPLALAQSGSEQLVSRSQAKRVLVRVEEFEYVVFDFSNVTSVGQGFADEIFRVFANAHPEIKLTATKMTPQVQGMIQAVQKEALRQAKAHRKSVPIASRG